MHKKITGDCLNSYSNSSSCSIGQWTNPKAKIGLMYLSDYVMSLGEDALSYIPKSDYITLKTGWMHLSNSDDSSSKWTMSRYGPGPNSTPQYSAWEVHSSGNISTSYTSSGSHARPLNSDVKIVGESNNITDPYIIN